MFILIMFAFLAGFATILSPCILPVLPIVLASSTASGKKRPFGIVLGFVLSFTFFTLALTFLVKATGIDPNILRSVAIVIIFIFGISMLIPQVILWLESLVSRLSSKVGTNKEQSDGFFGGLFVGMSLGLVWTPCAGPILASVITLAATSTVTLEAVLITMAYSVGTSIPMIGIIYGGRGLLKKVPFLLKNSAKIQKIFGIIIILVAVAMFFNLDRKFQAYIVEKFPEYGAGLTKLEKLDIVNDRLEALDMDEQELVVSGEQCDGKYPVAPGFSEGGPWINTEPLVLEELRGKVVLVDFWTYSCINCIRTLPYLNGWHEKYSDDGLVIVGVHAPEFEFEKDFENVRKAMADFGIEYAVIQDNDKKIWRSYDNRYWPAKYFVDKKGCVRSSHFGEGQYEESENIIRMLLEEDGEKISDSKLNLDEREFKKHSPETYLGYGRIDNFGSPEEILQDDFQQYSVPLELALDYFAYDGLWNLGDEKAQAKTGSTLQFHFQAKEVYLVMRPIDGGDGSVKVYLDGEVVDEENAGEDVTNGVVEVSSDRLYRLINLNESGIHNLKLEFLDDNVEVFAFTFG